MFYKLPIAGKWIEFTDADLIALGKGTKEEKRRADFLRDKCLEYEQNPLSFFLAHGCGADFLNNHEDRLLLMRGPNRCGKSFLLMGWLAYKGVPCDPNWPCFTQHGIKWREWGGAQEIAMASYTWGHVQRNLWNKLRQVLPLEELREYSPKWKPKDGRHVAKRRPNFRGGSPQCVLTCGTEIHMYAYQQPVEALEGHGYPYIAFDEQTPEDIFDAAWRGTATYHDPQVAFAYTPHFIEGRADSGTNSWLVKMSEGNYDKGLSYHLYTLSLDDVPDVVMPRANKEENYIKYNVAPKKEGNQKKIREGMARYHGIAQSPEAMVYGAYNENIHLIDPCDIPPEWTQLRGMDHGRKRPFACVWGAMTPWGDLVIHKEYKEAGLEMGENAMNVLRLSGNTRSRVGEKTNDVAGTVTKIYEEVCCGTQFQSSVMDGRCFAKPGETTTLGQRYNELGLSCTAAKCTVDLQAIPQVARWFELDAGRIHLAVRLGMISEAQWIEACGGKCAPRIYFFRTATKIRREIMSFINKPESEDVAKGDYHLLSGLKYMILEEPYYAPPRITRPDDLEDAIAADPFTGYVHTSEPYRL